MKKILFFTFIVLLSLGVYAQELEADDFVIITQENAAYPGFNARTYRGLFPVGHGQFKMFNYGGTPGNLSALGANETLGSFVFNGYDGNQNVISAVIQARTITDSRDPRFNFLLSNGVGNQRPNRMTILGQSGNVGIGITEPTERLDVNGNIRMRVGAVAGYIPVSDADGKMEWTDPTTIFTPSPWMEDTYGIRFMNGYVGIGTENPEGPLEVVASFGQNMVLSATTGNNDNYMGFKNGNDQFVGYAGIFNGANDIDFGTGYGNVTGNVNFTISSSPAMTLENTRDLGINTDAPEAQLHVVGDVSDGQNLIFVDVNNYSNSGNNSVRGIYVDADETGGYGYGGYFDGGYRGVNAYGKGGDATGTARGLYAESTGTAGSRFGAYGYASNPGGSYSYGIYGLAVNAVNNYGVYGSGYGGTDNYAGYFSGDVNVTGTFTNPSDRKLKRNISKYENALDAIQQLKVKNYEYNTDKYAYMQLSNEKQIGFIAQELEEVLPHLVSDQLHPETTETGDEGWKNVIAGEVDYKAINYLGLIPILTQGIKELVVEGERKDETINNLESELANVNQKMVKMTEMMDKMNNKLNQMEVDLGSCCLNDNVSADREFTTIELSSNTEQATLQQNAPNPFSEQTEINYYIPSTATKAQIIITDTRGAILKSVSLAETGLGTLVIKAGELAPGTYAYTLFIDGNKVATKQMILMK